MLNKCFLLLYNMVLFALTNITLDVTLGVAWWLVKNTVYSTYCIGSYLFCSATPPTKESPKKEEMLELQYQIAELNKKLDTINTIQPAYTTQITQTTETNRGIEHEYIHVEQN